MSMAARLASLLVLACLAALPPAARCAAPDPLKAIDECLARLDAGTDVGYARIASRCAELARALEGSGWSAWLPRGWNEPGNDLSAGSLRELRVLVARELATTVEADRAPSVQRLEQVLAELGPAGQERGGLWARLRNWLQTILESRGQEDGPHWLDRMIERVGRSQVVIELITYASLALIIVLAVLIVVNELRAAGVLRSRRRREEDRDVEAELPRPRARVTMRDVEAAELRHKPRLMLELVTEWLAERRMLPPPRGLTVRELLRSAELAQAEDRARLAKLAEAAEQESFAEHGAAPSMIESAVACGRELLDRLQRGELGARPGSLPQ